VIIVEIIVTGLHSYIWRMKVKGAPQSPIVSVLGSCCLGKSPKLGEVLSCYSLWRSGANPVASNMATAARKASCPWSSQGPFKRIQLLPFIHFLHCVPHQPKLEFAHLSSPSTLFRWQFLNLFLWITITFSPLHPLSAFLVDNDEQISLSGWCGHVLVVKP